MQPNISFLEGKIIKCLKCGILMSFCVGKIIGKTIEKYILRKHTVHVHNRNFSSTNSVHCLQARLLTLESGNKK